MAVSQTFRTDDKCVGHSLQTRLCKSNCGISSSPWDAGPAALQDPSSGAVVGDRYLGHPDPRSHNFSGVPIVSNTCCDS